MSFIEGKKLGIVGGGQLAKMLAASAQKMGAHVYIYSERTDDPAASVTSNHKLGALSDPQKINLWSQNLDMVTFESEFLNFESIKLKKQAPNAKSMTLVRDRLSQKKLLEKFKIPTSPFNSPKATSQFSAPLVLKQRLFGYDGYGTVVCKNKKSYERFLKNTSDLSTWIEEDFVPFKRELAFSLARNESGDFCQLPLVETFQKDSKCFWVKGPVRHTKLKALVSKAKKMMSSLNYVGMMAFELFETSDGNLLVNELAPRVHNSAHYSIEGLELSQFDVHVLAVFNQKIPSQVKPVKAFSMVNLIGSSKRKPKLSPLHSGQLHWYGKSENRPGRKMGHITCLASSPSQALKSALKAEKEQVL